MHYDLRFINILYKKETKKEKNLYTQFNIKPNYFHLTHKIVIFYS